MDKIIASRALFIINTTVYLSTYKQLNADHLEALGEATAQLTDAVRGDDYVQKRVGWIQELLKLSFFGCELRPHLNRQEILEETEKLTRHVQRWGIERANE